MKMLMIHFMMKINGNKYKKKIFENFVSYNRTPNKPSTPNTRSNKLNIKNEERPKTPKPR
jgi:hypothetical protein